MSVKYVEGDLFAVVDNNVEKSFIVPHCCNDKGAFGAGFVVPLGRRFPKCKQDYLDWHNTKLCQLGQTQIVEVCNDPLIFVANMVAQTLGGSRPLFYNHLSRCMDEVAKFVLTQDKLQIIAPMFGSNLAGGDWNIIEKLIEDCWLRKNISVTICYLSGTLPDNWELPKGADNDKQEIPS